MSAGAHGGQKGPLDPLELELQVSVSLSMCVLGTEPRPSARVVSAFLKHPSSPVVLSRMVRSSNAALHVVVTPNHKITFIATSSLQFCYCCES